MRNIRVVLLVAVLSACSSSDPPPSCFQAFTHYYNAGCTLVDLQTSQPVPVNQIIGDCQSGTASTPDRCRDEEDAFLSCINESTPAMGCDCSQEQMALLRCN